MEPPTTFTHAHRPSVERLVQDLSVDPKSGLTAGEARRRYENYGPNALQETQRESGLAILLRQFTGGIVYILLAAAGIAFFLGDTVEGVAILAVLLTNALIGFALKWNARQSMDALRKMNTSPASVLREGRVRKIPYTCDLKWKD